jgi:predicted HicB family RNase H-like nuclease
MLSNVLSYKGYRAEFGFDADAGLLHGRVIGINTMVDILDRESLHAEDAIIAAE